MFADSDYIDFRHQVRDFCEREIAPLAEEADETQKFSPAAIKKLHDQGWWAIQVAPEYGGRGWNTVQYSIIVEELSRVCGSTGLAVAAHNSLGAGPISYFGTPEQKQRYLHFDDSEPYLIAFGLTEPQAGSDAGATKSVAEPRDDHYILNGTKCWITSAGLCKYAIVTARTDKSTGVHGISSFVIEKGMAGFSVGKKENKLGCRGSDTAFLHFDDLKVPRANLIGKEGEGFKQFMKTLDGGRISIGAMALGLAQGAFEAATRYAATHEFDGVPLADQQWAQFKLADMGCRIEAARGLIYGASVLRDQGKPYSQQSAMAKLYASEVCNFATSEALSIIGMESQAERYPVERMWRDMKLTEIGEGTSEIQRLVISRAILKSVQTA
ncbi:MAG: acyl-CoA dehydrogenase family protein [candidate division Zixibacteria bacterium]|nr:acyl-CoA dehydrogenase family protein [candidate division Zixibacteria bacterium]